MTSKRATFNAIQLEVLWTRLISIVDEAAKAASQPLLYEFVRVLGELSAVTMRLNDEGERRAYLVALGSPLP